MRALRFGLLALCFGASLLAMAVAAGEAGGREPFFPASGNAGIDVRHHGVAFAFDPRSGAIGADAAIKLKATRDLRRFPLDLDGLRVTTIEVDGELARFSRSRGKLWIEPAATIPAGEVVDVAVFYRSDCRW